MHKSAFICTTTSLLRTNIGGIEGVITQKVSGDPKNPVYEKTFEVFIPDKHSGSTSLFYRRFINGSWQNWNKLAELTWDAPSLTNENNNVPSVRQMQQDIDKEIKKMVDEANR